MFGYTRLLNRFTTRMILAFVIVILIPTLFTSASFYVVSNHIVKNNVRESSVQIAKQAADSLSFIFNAGSDMSDLIYTDQRIQHVVIDDVVSYQNLQEWRENEKYVGSFLNNLVYTSSFVNIVYVLKNENSSWGSGDFSKVKLAKYDIENLDWAKAAKSKNGGLVWLGLQDDRLSGGGDNTELVLPIGRVLKNLNTMEDIGYVLVNLNGRKIIDTLQRMKLGETGGFFVVNEEGRVMVHPDTSRINRAAGNEDLVRNIVSNDSLEFEFMQGDIPYYGVKQRLSNGWLIVGTVPIHEITDKLDSLHSNILLSSGIVSLVGILIGLFIAGRVLRPIKQLTQQMKMVQQGDLSVRTNVISNDEFGLMSRQFNRMITDINRLMEQVTHEQKQKQEAELRAVFHRINPHFLFNTLSTLGWLIKSDQSDKAYEGLSALIRLLDANMGKKGNFITIEEELDIIEKYLAILELRYGKIFKLNIMIDPVTAEFIIPRMLIQPLVENAIFHGIVPKGTDGVIDITVKQQFDSVIITVKDNGMGIISDKSLIEESISEAVISGQTGIGLSHVYESIELYFDTGSEIQLFNHKNEGTIVQITLITKRLT